MEVVIKIPDEVFEAYKHWDENKVATVEQTLIAHGTVLPKGHGRLIENNEELYQSIRNWCSPDKAYEILTKAKTIVEADKG